MGHTYRTEEAALLARRQELSAAVAVIDEELCRLRAQWIRQGIQRWAMRGRWLAPWLLAVAITGAGWSHVENREPIYVIEDDPEIERLTKRVLEMRAEVRRLEASRKAAHDFSHIVGASEAM